MGSKCGLILGTPLDCLSLELRKADLSGAFWPYNEQIDSFSDVIIFPFNSNLTFALICLSSVHFVIFITAKFLLYRMKEKNPCLI